MSDRRVTNIRPQGQPDAKAYAPERDLAYLYPNMLREAFISLDAVNWPQEFAEKLQYLEITEDDIAVAVGKFMEGLTLFTREPEVRSVEDAFARSGFAAERPLIKDLLFARFGEVLTGGWFIAVRDVTLQGYESDAADAVTRMTEAGRLLMLMSRRARNKMGVDLTPEQLEGWTRYEPQYREAQRTLQQLHTIVANKTMQTAEANLQYIELKNQTDATMAAVREWVDAPLWKQLWLGVTTTLRVMIMKAGFNVSRARTR